MSIPISNLSSEELEFIIESLPSQEQTEKYFEYFPINKRIYSMERVYSVEPKVTATEELQQSIALDLQCEDKAVGELLGE